jgi:DMSO/TMAO reductase YedYZ molybdopterin-dependent catalytic subunit
VVFSPYQLVDAAAYKTGGTIRPRIITEWHRQGYTGSRPRDPSARPSGSAANRLGRAERVSLCAQSPGPGAPCGPRPVPEATVEEAAMSIWDPLKRVERLRRAGEARSPGTGSDRVPPGQSLTAKFPVLTYGATPRVRREDWRLRAWGLLDAERTWTWDEFLALPSQEQVCDIHCVTRWSKLDTRWRGIPFTAVLGELAPRPEADHVLIHCYGGYTTNMRLDELLTDDVMFAYEYDGQPLEPDHGGPMRLLVPQLYLWKSAKWVNGLEFMAGNRPGFWESYGYHMHGDPWTEERFG